MFGISASSRTALISWKFLDVWTRRADVHLGHPTPQLSKSENDQTLVDGRRRCDNCNVRKLTRLLTVCPCPHSRTEPHRKIACQNTQFMIDLISAKPNRLCATITLR